MRAFTAGCLLLAAANVSLALPYAQLDFGERQAALRQRYGYGYDRQAAAPSSYDTVVSSNSVEPKSTSLKRIRHPKRQAAFPTVSSSFFPQSESLVRTRRPFGQSSFSSRQPQTFASTFDRQSTFEFDPPRQSTRNAFNRPSSTTTTSFNTPSTRTPRQGSGFGSSSSGTESTRDGRQFLLSRPIPVGPQEPAIPILQYSFNSPIDGGDWDYSYETANGIRAEAQGQLKRVGDVDVNVQRGSYEYLGPDGVVYRVDWFADETGFHPTGSHLPIPVPIPFADQAAAVAAQRRFAAEQSGSNNNNGDQDQESRTFTFNDQPTFDSIIPLNNGNNNDNGQFDDFDFTGTADTTESHPPLASYGVSKSPVIEDKNDSEAPVSSYGVSDNPVLVTDPIENSYFVEPAQSSYSSSSSEPISKSYGVSEPTSSYGVAEPAVPSYGVSKSKPIVPTYGVVSEPVYTRYGVAPDYAISDTYESPSASPSASPSESSFANASSNKIEDFSPSNKDFSPSAKDETLTRVGVFSRDGISRTTNYIKL